MTERIYQARKTAFLTRRELLRLTFAGALVLLAGTTWRQASTGAEAAGDGLDGRQQQQVSSTLMPAADPGGSSFL